jgi:multiple sugar transport system permease protein
MTTKKHLRFGAVVVNPRFRLDQYRPQSRTIAVAKLVRRSTYMIPALVMADAWRATGFNMVIFLAGMKNIPKEYYEAATIDGANAFAKMRFIMIPALGPVFFLVIVNALISALQIFDLPWLMSNSSFSGYGGPLQGMLFPVMDVIGRGFGGRRFGEAAACASISFVLILGVTTVQLAFRRRWRAF